MVDLSAVEDAAQKNQIILPPARELDPATTIPDGVYDTRLSTKGKHWKHRHSLDSTERCWCNNQGARKGNIENTLNTCPDRPYVRH